MLLLSRSNFDEEGNSEATRGDKLGNGKEEKNGRREKEIHQTEMYRFKESGIGDGWLIGNDTTNWPNAYVKGMSGCEEPLEIPHELTDESGNTKNVEVIGQYAFYACGDKDNKGITRSIVLSRYIKVIKRYGLGVMDDVTSFRIEEGSCLESIEYRGLSLMGWKNTNESDRKSILVLPSTVTNIAEYGLHRNNLIKTIYYCGSTHLSNYNELMWEVSVQDIKVTGLYTYETIFKDYTPKKDRESIAEAEKICDKFKPKASPSPSYSPSYSPSPSPLSPSSPTKAGTTLSKYSKFLAASYLL